MKRRSKQRDAVRVALCSVRTHPSAVEIYDMVRGEFPHISLATVYRNLSELVNSGQAIAITTQGGATRYDGFVREHSHFYCMGCGSVYDVDVPVRFDADSTPFEIDRCSVVFYGHCAECKQ